MLRNTFLTPIKDRNIIFELSRKQIKSQYRGSVLGYIWTVLNPLLNMLVMFIVFKELLGRDDPYYTVYLLTGNILFAALRNATTQSLPSLVNNRGLLFKVKIKPYVFPFSYTVSSLINFMYSLLALIPFMIYLSIDRSLNLFSYQLLFIIIMLPAFWLFEYGIGLLLSCLFVFFRDIKHIYGVFLTLWHYLTPIFYKVERLSEIPQMIVKFNPMYYFVDFFRQCVYMSVVEQTGLPNFAELGICYGCGVVMFLLGIVVFSSLEKKVTVNI